MDKPPFLFRKLLEWFCATELLEELEGDLEEAFTYNRESKGLFRAKCIYAKEVVFLMRPSVLKKFNNNINSTIMIRNYGKVAFRNFIKNKTYAIINILSMAIGLACCITAYLNYEHNNSFDYQHVNADSIYRINYSEPDGQKIRNYGTVPQKIATQSSEITNVKDVCRYVEWYGNAKIGDTYFEMNVAYTDDNFLSMFTFPLINGSAEALSRKNAVLISHDMAMRLYGELDVKGKHLTCIHRGEESTYIIEGLLEKLPSNSSFQFDVIVNIDNLKDHTGEDAYATTFLLLDQPNKASTLESSINKLAAKRQTSDESNRQYYLDPLKGMASRAEANSVIGPLEVSLPWFMEFIPAAISGMILLLACFTFTNTSIASAAGRLKEIGVRKVMGGRNSQVAFQFLMESMIICVLAIVLAMPLADFLARQYNQLLPFLNLELTLSGSSNFLLFLIGLVLLAGLIAGGYPAFYLSKFQPGKILKGTLKYKSVGRLTKLLLTTQFVFAMLVISASILFVQNAHFQEKTELGFDTEQTIVVRFGDTEGTYSALNNELAKNPRISDLSASVDHVGRRYHQASVKHEDLEVDIAGLDVGPNYIKTVELELLEGRDFNDKSTTDYEESIIVNQKLVETFNWDNPIGQKITYQDSLNYYVIGVVKDFYFDAFNSPVEPLWMRLRKPEEYNYLIAKTSPDQVASVMEEIKMTWRNLFNSELDDIKPPEYPKNEGQTINSIMLKVLVFMGSIAAVMSLIGFYSLVSLNLFGRMKEIGVRRVLGSNTLQVIKVINRDYIFILLVGILSGAIISYLLIPILMDTLWASHVSPSFTVSLLSIAAMLLTCILTVGVKVFKAANTNPVHLLKDE